MSNYVDRYAQIVKRRLENSYFEWLISKINSPGNIVDNYKKLLSLLKSIEFVYCDEMDKNRYMDGAYLRQEYCNDFDVVFEDDRHNYCSVLEMMIALALRCEIDYMQIPGEKDRTYKWFWLMIENMNLIWCDDTAFDQDLAKAHVYNMMFREYSPDGTGGLFKIPGRTDMREKEIWLQMHSYLTYYIEVEGKC